MSSEEMSPERTRAFYKFKEAEQQAAKHHYDQALNHAHDALDIDPTFLEVRHWIAELYRKQDQVRKASMVYQEIIHQNRDDQKAWAALRQLEPAAADRLERLHDIAPDPFVVARTTAVSDDLEDLAAFGDEAAAAAPEEEPVHAQDIGMDDMADVAATGGVLAPLEAEVGSIVGVQPAAAAAVEPAPDGPPSDWLYEEDLKYRDKMARHPIYAKLLPLIVEFWRDDKQWDVAISGSVHLDAHRHPEIVEVCREVEQRMGTPKWQLYVCPERRMVSCITRGDPPTLSLTTGCMNHLSRPDQVFMVGRFTTMLLAGHLPFLEMVMMTLERTSRTITDVEIDMLEMLKEHHAGWDAGVHRDDRMKLSQLCHAWQQRAELSGDRGGLICCRDLTVACDAIAKLTAADSTAAEKASAHALAEKFAGQDAAQLAVVPLKEDPIRSEGYALYRIKMLRWWAKTPAAQALWG